MLTVSGCTQCSKTEIGYAVITGAAYMWLDPQVNISLNVVDIMFLFTDRGMLSLCHQWSVPNADEVTELVAWNFVSDSIMTKLKISKLNDYDVHLGGSVSGCYSYTLICLITASQSAVVKLSTSSSIADVRTSMFSDFSWFSSMAVLCKLIGELAHFHFCA